MTHDCSTNHALDQMRMRSLNLIVAICWIHAPICLIISYLVGTDMMMVTGLSIALALLATCAPRIAGAEAGRAITLAALQGQAAVIVAALSGHPWQVDAHMYFFALMAVGFILVDMGALIAAAAVVAVHHLTLNFVAAELIYPGGGDIGRTLIHAVILIIETSVLLFAVHLVQNALSNADASKREAEKGLENAQLAQSRADSLEQESAATRKAMITELEAVFGEVVAAAEAGDLSKRAKTDFEAEELNRLAGALNRLVQTVDQTLDAVVATMDDVAAGNLRARMHGQYDGRFGDLQNGINTTTERLSRVFTEIGGMAQQMKGETSKVAGAASEQATRAEQQASSLQETAATVEEMTTTVKSNAESASSGRLSADAAADCAQRGGDIVKQAVSAMERISDGSGRISDIISVIDGIAFQTNLLALNAAVEAARAGDAGRGFAVVASEVRALAQRSADAAQDIKRLISESTEDVASGVDLVNKTGAALSEIVHAIQNVSRTVTEISNATGEQSSSISEINSAISHIDQMTQRNAAMAGQSASSSTNLAQQAAHLADLVAKFEFGDAEDAADASWRTDESLAEAS